MGQAAALSGLIGLTGPLAIVLKPPPVTWLGLISANIGYFIYAPFLSSRISSSDRRRTHSLESLIASRVFLSVSSDSGKHSSCRHLRCASKSVLVCFHSRKVWSSMGSLLTEKKEERPTAVVCDEALESR